MKIIKTDTEILIYPLLHENWIEQEDDYCIVMDSSGFIVDGRMWNEDEIEEVIEGLEKILELAHFGK
jgi:hypothetical protein